MAKLRVFETYQEMCKEVALEMQEQLKANPKTLLCIASGHTSTGLFECLVRMFEDGSIDFSKAAFIAMDEWLNMSEKTPGSCGAFVNTHFLNKVNFEQDNIRLFDGTASDLTLECGAADEFIIEKSQHGVMDYVVLGSGMNGHLALNEPGCDFNTRVHVARLDESTKQVGQKYFQEKTELSGGITLGIGNFAEARRCVLMISGSHKHEILHKIVESQISNKIPATVIKKFANASIFCDNDAYCLAQQ